jgi:hypothetical protein
MNEKSVTFYVQIQRNFFKILTYVGIIAIYFMSAVGWRQLHNISMMHGPQLVDEDIWEIR